MQKSIKNKLVLVQPSTKKYAVESEGWNPV